MTATRRQDEVLRFVYRSRSAPFLDLMRGESKPCLSSSLLPLLYSGFYERRPQPHHTRFLKY